MTLLILLIACSSAPQSDVDTEHPPPPDVQRSSVMSRPRPAGFDTSIPCPSDAASLELMTRVDAIHRSSYEQDLLLVEKRSYGERMFAIIVFVQDGMRYTFERVQRDDLVIDQVWWRINGTTHPDRRADWLTATNGCVTDDITTDVRWNTNAGEPNVERHADSQRTYTNILEIVAAKLE